MKSYVARQPIFKRNQSVVGYELLFRDSQENRFPVGTPGNVSTAKVLINSFLNMDFDDIVEDKYALVNFPIETLRDGYPDLMPSEKVIIEILETVQPNQETHDLLRSLWQKRYKIALDDFIFHEDWIPMLKYVSVIKFDIQQTPLHTILHLIPMLRKHKVQLLAEKVETKEEYKECYDAGFDFFQGYFFSKPELVSGNEASISEYLIMNIYYESVKDEMDFNKLTSLFQQESTLAYQLLKLVNNIAKQKNKEINSIKQALVFLGESNVRRFVSMLVTGQLGKNKTPELVKLAFIRAIFCERICAQTKISRKKDDLFLVGLLSTIDAILDKEMSIVMDTLPVNNEIKECLTNRTGAYYYFLMLIESIENANWNLVEKLQRKLGVTSSSVIDTYQWAIKNQRQNTKVFIAA